MRLSDDKINELSHKIADILSVDDRVRFESDYNDIRTVIRKSIGKSIRKEAGINTLVEEKISSQKQKIVRGTAEWDALFWQYYEDEIGKLRSIR